MFNFQIRRLLKSFTKQNVSFKIKLGFSVKSVILLSIKQFRPIIEFVRAPVRSGKSTDQTIFDGQSTFDVVSREFFCKKKEKNRFSFRVLLNFFFDSRVFFVVN